MPRPEQLRTLMLCAAAATPLGIAVHLGAEAIALGPAGLHVDFLTRHLYFIVVASLGYFGGRRLLMPYVRRGLVQVHALRRDLPWHGRGKRFFTLLYAVQFGFAGLTLAAEGHGLSRGDWTAGALTALLIALAGARLLAILPGHIVRTFAGAYLRRERLRLYERFLRRQQPHRVARLLATGFETIAGNRPPPLPA